LDNSSAVFICGNINYSGQILDEGKIKFFLQNPTDKVEGINLETGNYTLNAWFINTGSPHVVINVDDINLKSETEADPKSIEELPVTTLGREIRYHSRFSPEGTNVNFIKIEGDKVLIRTYERGVENETLACGTGSVASAIFVYENYGITPPIKLITRGKEELSVDFSPNGNSVGNPSLTGPANIVYKGKISISNL
jgi:diaminopimelate epimerase